MSSPIPDVIPGYSLFQQLVGGAGLLRELCDGVAGLFRELLDAFLQAAIGLAELYQPGAELVELALGVAPEASVFLPVLSALLGDSGGEVLDSIEPFFGGHCSSHMGGQQIPDSL
jgi:hypothetical protein